MCIAYQIWYVQCREKSAKCNENWRTRRATTNNTHQHHTQTTMNSKELATRTTPSSQLAPNVEQLHTIIRLNSNMNKIKNVETFIGSVFTHFGHRWRIENSRVWQKRKRSGRSKTPFVVRIVVGVFAGMDMNEQEREREHTRSVVQQRRQARILSTHEVGGLKINSRSFNILDFL